MNAKKWLLCFAGTILLLAVLLAAFNGCTDPFGVFGDPIFDWYSYNETNNPRAAKLVYLKDHLDDYDSYVLGCSSTSSFPVQALEEVYGGSFYNLFTYGADMQDVEQTVGWLLDHDEVRNIFLNVYIDNGLSYAYESNPYTDAMHPEADGSSKLRFYARFAFANPAYGFAKLRARRTDTWLSQSFDVFDTETGAYDKRKRDIEQIGALDAYLERYPVFTDYPKSTLTLSRTDDCMASVARIRAMCEEAGVQLTVAAAPVYWEYMENFSRDDVERFYTALAEVTDFWDFSYSSVSFEPRYFYDGTHFRNCVGDMALARIAGAEDTYLPADFGTLVTGKMDFSDSWAAAPIPEDELCAQVPILLYHHLSETEQSSATVTPQRFRSHMEALRTAGYTAVTFDDLLAFVYSGAALPEKPVVITFDDGYESNFSLADPILQDTGLCATICLIGSSVGKDTYKDTGVPIHPHFSEAQAKEMVASGRIDLQSHTYDMHQSASLESGPARTTVSPLEGEAEGAFIAAMEADFLRSRTQLEAITGKCPTVLAYPEGIYSDLTQATAWASGFRVTLTSDPGTNTLVRGLPQSLLGLKRDSITEAVRPEALLALISE